MSNRELNEIVTSLRRLIRRAYDLGREDALRKVVGVLGEKQTSNDALALMAANDAFEDAPSAPWSGRGAGSQSILAREKNVPK